MNREKVKSVRIQNFKSVVDLTLDLGSFNVLIGENGCGKSNILEAIAFSAAASAGKLDYEFLGSRGIRITNPEFMYSAFGKKEEEDRTIEVWYDTEDGEEYDYRFPISNDPNNPRKWINKLDNIKDYYLSNLTEEDDKLRQEIAMEAWRDKAIVKSLEDTRNLLLKAVRERMKDSAMDEMQQYNLFNMLLKSALEYSLGSGLGLSNFVIYAPEQSSLRRFEDTNQIYPLGIRGEGLFQYLKELGANEKNKDLLNEIKNNLTLLDWYEKFDLPESSLSNDFTLHIKDRYLNPDLQYFDQRSTNEGFLYLLFYSTLFLSKDTPAFFAIDNIDTSLNPKLCMQLTRNLAELAQKSGKQVIVTTQNPAILDGLNLKDDDQRLFVISRNDEGHTQAERIEYKAERRLKLSEVWTSGFIGGLPENF